MFNIQLLHGLHSCIVGLFEWDLTIFYACSEYSIHYTRMKPGGAGGVQCRVRPKDQQIRTITTSGTENTKIIYSPGFILNKKYDSYFHVYHLSFM